MLFSVAGVDLQSKPLIADLSSAKSLNSVIFFFLSADKVSPRRTAVNSGQTDHPVPIQIDHALPI